jgi:hypothetical protein
VVVGSEGRRGKGCDAALPSFLSLQVAMKHVYMYIYVETERGSVSVMSERRKDYTSWSGISAGGGEGACMLSIGRNSMQHEQTHHTRERERDGLEWRGAFSCCLARGLHLPLHQPRILSKYEVGYIYI